MLPVHSFSSHITLNISSTQAEACCPLCRAFIADAKSVLQEGWSRDNSPCSRNKVSSMTVASNVAIWLERPEWQPPMEALHTASSLRAMVCIVLQMALMVGRWLIDAEFRASFSNPSRRVELPHLWPSVELKRLAIPTNPNLDGSHHLKATSRSMFSGVQREPIHAA